MRITFLFLTIMGLCTLYALILDLGFGLAYGAATLPLVVMQYVGGGRLRRIDQIALTVSVLSIWAFYMLRPLFLFSNPQFFKFVSGYQIDTRTHIDTLYWVALSNLMFLLPFAVVLRLTCAYKTEVLFKRDKLLRNVRPLLIMLMGVGGIYVFASLFALISPEIGGSTLSLIELLLPIEFLAPVALALLISSSVSLGRWLKVALYFVLCTYLVSQLLQGSKSFLLEIAFLAVVIALIRFGDFVVPVRRIVRYTAWLVILFVSFPLAMAVRRISDESGLNGLSIVALIERVQFMSTFGHGNSVFTFSLDLITKRLNGYDGSLAALQIPSDTLPNLFNLEIMIVNGFAGIVPGAQSTFESFGAATSRIFFSFLSDDSNAHGGGIGAYAMLRLFANSNPVGTLFATGVYGMIWALMILVTVRLRTSALVRYGAFGGLIIAYTLSTSGGNFDRILREMIALYFHFALLSLYMRVRWDLARKNG